MRSRSLHPRSRIRRSHRTQRPDEQTDRNRVRAISRLIVLRPPFLLLLVFGRSVQFRALTRFQHAEDDHADEGADELGQGGEEIEDAEIDARGLARGGVGGRGGRVVHVAVQVVQAQEGGGWGGGCEFVLCGGEAAVGGAVGEHGVRGGEAVDFDAHEGEGGPAG